MRQKSQYKAPGYINRQTNDNDDLTKTNWHYGSGGGTAGGNEGDGGDGNGSDTLGDGKGVTGVGCNRRFFDALIRLVRVLLFFCLADTEE